MARLAVNVDHVATVREARGISYPDPVIAAGLAETAGADCIICHLREDRRHINDRDLRILRQTVQTRLNMEMAAVDEMVEDGLSIFDIEHVILTGKIRKTEIDDLRGTRYTIIGLAEDEETEVGVVGRFTETNIYLIITVYEITE